MPAKAFFDSSVLIYTLSRTDPKSMVAFGLLGQGGIISVQVLNEFANVASKKLRLDWERIEEILDELREFLELPVSLTLSIHELGLAIARRYKYTIYDSLLIAAALESGCGILYSEDMQDGQQIGGVTIRNPFVNP
jgi:predicted nucleic acid-binding protein